MSASGRRHRREGHRRDTEARREEGGVRAFPEPPGASMPTPGLPTLPNSHPDPNPARQLAQERGSSLTRQLLGPRPRGRVPCGTALPWRRRVRFRQSVSRIGPNSSGRRGLGRGPGREVGVRATVSLGRDRRGPCDPGRYQEWVAGKARARALRSHSKPPPLQRLRPLKGGGPILSRRHKGATSASLPPRP